MKSLQLRLWTVLLTSAALLACARPASAEPAAIDPVLKQIPSDAWGFIVIPSLEGLNNGVNMFQKEVMGQAMMDLMAMVSIQMGLEKGLDSKSAAAIFAMDATKYGNQPFAVLLPATDTKELMANFTPAAEENGITPCDINGEAFFARVSGKFVMLTQSKELATAVGEMKSSVEGGLTPARKKLLGDRLLSACIPVGRLVEVYKEQIVGMFQMMQAMSGQASSQPSDDTQEMIKQIKQMEWLDVHLGFDSAGLALTGVITPVKGSDMEDMTKKLKGSDALLKGLPGEAFAIAAGFAVPQDEKAYAQVDNMVKRALESPMMGEKPEMKQALTAMYDKVRSMAKTISRGAMCVLPVAEGGDGVFGLSAIIDTEDSAKILEGIGTLKDDAMKAAKGNADAEKALAAMDHKKDAEEIESVKVNHFTIDPTKEEGMDEEEIAHMKKVIGSDGIAIRMAAADGKHVVMGLGGGKKHFADVIKAAKSGANGLGDEKGVMAMTKSLPGRRTAELYIDVDTAARLVKRLLVAVGEQDPIPSVPDIAAPVAIVTSVDGAISRSDFVVPMEVIRGVRGMVMSSMMAQQQGGQDGEGAGDGDEDSESDSGDSDAGEKPAEKPAEKP